MHDVSYPKGYDPSTSSSCLISCGGDAAGPAKTFPFQLDTFQAEAICSLDNGESVMVIAVLCLCYS